jgi:DNA-directed RNA polymerase sigma subunit (sigma70/sigma32)
MTDDHSTLDYERLGKLREAMSQSEIEALQARFKSDPHSLSLDEAGVLFLVTRERIRGFKERARRKRGDPEDPGAES